jgi:hypothetical protein
VQEKKLAEGGSERERSEMPWFDFFVQPSIHISRSSLKTVVSFIINAFFHRLLINAAHERLGSSACASELTM